MFTSLRFTPPVTGDAKVDALGRAIAQYLLSLEQKDALAINAASITATNGIAFPATQNPSTDANTLDDYEEGDWTPVLTFTTPGDVAVTYATQLGEYTKVGREVTLRGSVTTSTFTHTTASGNLTITGLPFAVGGSIFPRGALLWGGITKAGYTNIVATGTSSSVMFSASGSGVANSGVVVADTPTGGTVRLEFTLHYRV
jgi:hypothetical protein